MRASVSDILTYAKCPYAWWFSQRYGIKGRPTKPMIIGTEIHKEVENYLGGGIPGPHLEKLTVEERVDLLEVYVKGEVEYPIMYTVGNHTITSRLDGYKKDENQIIQLKSVPANKSHYSDYVRVGLHENMYAYGIMQEMDIMEYPTIRTILYVKTKIPKLIIMPYCVITSKNMQAAIDFSNRCLNEMEALSGVQDEEEAKIYKTPPSCIEWSRGYRCEFYGHCHEHKRFTDPSYVKIKERYPEFAEKPDF